MRISKLSDPDRRAVPWPARCKGVHVARRGPPGLLQLGCAERLQLSMASHAAPTVGRVLASMRPYTVVAAICRVGGRSYGLALSDPYLSHATPLGTVRGTGNAVLCAGMLRLPVWPHHLSPASFLFAAPRFIWACRCDAWGPMAVCEPTPRSVSPRRSTRRQELQQALQDAPVGALLVVAPLQRHSSATLTLTLTQTQTLTLTPTLTLALALARAMHSSATPRFPRAAAALQRSLEARLARCSSFGRLPRVHGPLTTLAYAREQQREEPELWEAVGVPLGGSRSKVPPAVQAAAALQTVLDEEMGGWRNTFG